MGAIGLAFQMPIGLLGLQRAGIINGSTLTRHWRYATVGIAVIAAALPGADPVTTALELTDLRITETLGVVSLVVEGLLLVTAAAVLARSRRVTI